MVTPISFINSPTYAVGEVFVNNRENEYWSLGSGSEYLSYEYSQWESHSGNEYDQHGDYAPSSIIR